MTDDKFIEAAARALCAADPEVRMGDAEGVVQQRVDELWPLYAKRAQAAASILRSAFVPRVEVGEPVGWLYECEGEVWTATELENPDCFDVPFTETPLYPEAALATLQAQLAEAQAELARVREALVSAVSFVEALADNDPDEPIADNGMTVLGKLQFGAPELAIKMRAAIRSA